MEQLLECVPLESRHTISGFLLQLQARIDALENDVGKLEKENEVLKETVIARIMCLNMASSHRIWQLISKKNNIRDAASIIKKDFGDIVDFWAPVKDQKNTNNLIMYCEMYISPIVIHNVVNDADFMIIPFDFRTHKTLLNANCVKIEI